MYTQPLGRVSMRRYLPQLAPSAKVMRLRAHDCILCSRPQAASCLAHIGHTPFLDTCSLIILATLFAAYYLQQWLASDFMPTLYELKRWLGLTIPPLLVTCVMLMMYKMSNASFSTAPVHKWSLSKGLMLPYFLLQA